MTGGMKWLIGELGRRHMSGMRAAASSREPGTRTALGAKSEVTPARSANERRRIMVSQQIEITCPRGRRIRRTVYRGTTTIRCSCGCGYSVQYTLR
jgi:hypothetical protein